MSWWRGIVSASGRAAGLGIVLVILAAIAVSAPYWWHRVQRGLAPSYDGQIIVNSPAVYTRQRLVNDRLSQSAWLQDQLLVTKDGPTRFRSIDEVRGERVARALVSEMRVNQRPSSDAAAAAPAALLASDQARSAEGGAAASQRTDGAQGDEAPNIEPTTADLFRAKNTYREEVRSEIMETQLDDRHDIQGNTIYRLSFDATVLPGTRTDALAVIKVGLNHGMDQLDGEYYQLYEDWLRYMQRNIANSIEAIANQLQTRTPDPRLRVELPNFIVRVICEKTEIEYRSLKVTICNPEAMEPTARFSKDVHEMAGREKIKIEDLPKIAEQRITATKRRISAYTEAYLKYRQEVRQAQVASNIRIAAASQNLDPGAFKYGIPVVWEECVRNSGRVDLKDPDNGAGISVDCPPTDPPLEGLIGAAILYSKIDQREVATAEEVATLVPTLIKELRDQCVEANKARCAVPNPRFEQLRCLAADYMWGNLNRFDPLVVNSTVQRFDHYFQVKLVGQETGNCELLFGPKIRDGNENEDPVKRLVSGLNRAIEVYSYSITPKNLAQRISTTSDTRDAIQALLSARQIANERDMSALVQSLQQRASYSRAIQSHPVVVGFGIASKPTASINQSPPLGSKDPPVTQFGWVVAPQLQAGNENERIQTDRQYPLAAVISVPAWWRSVRLSIETCWVSREDIHRHARFEGCNKGEKPAVENHVVRLPGAIQELSRKLGFDVLQEPRLEGQTNPGNRLRIQVGRPADILLKGGRIWRSTEVTLGAQKADEIVVLPNMEGLVARFRCVHQQMPSDLAELDVNILVWTSEGVTEPEYARLIRQPIQKQTSADPASLDGKASSEPPSGPWEGVLCPEERKALEVRGPNRAAN
jgi:hypothetical protein